MNKKFEFRPVTPEQYMPILESLGCKYPTIGTDSHIYIGDDEKDVDFKKAII